MLGPIKNHDPFLRELPFLYEAVGDLHLDAGRNSLAEKCYCYALRFCDPSCSSTFQEIAKKHLLALERMDG